MIYIPPTPLKGGDIRPPSRGEISHPPSRERICIVAVTKYQVPKSTPFRGQGAVNGGQGAVNTGREISAYNSGLIHPPGGDLW